MDVENKEREAEAILAAIESGTPLRGCDDIADDLRKVITLLENSEDTEQSQRLQWDYAVCRLSTHTCVGGSWEKGERFEPPVEYKGGGKWPDPDSFPESAMIYFEDRAAQVMNPVLKARYHDFLWEKSSRQVKHKHAIAAIAAYLESAHRFAELTEASAPIEMIDALDRAASLSLQLNDAQRVADVVTTLVELIDRLRDVTAAEEDEELSAGRWLLELADILLHIKQNPRFSNVIEDATVRRLQQTADELADRLAASGEFLIEREFLEITAQAATMLRDNGAAFRFRRRYGESFEKEAMARASGPNASHRVAAAFYEDALHFYSKLRDDERTPVECRPQLQQRMDALKGTIREMYRLGRSEMEPIGVSFEIPREEFEQVMAYFLKPDTLHECLTRVASEGSLLPNTTAAHESAKQMERRAPLSSLLPKSMVSDDMTVAEAVSDDERFRYEVDLYLVVQIGTNSHIILHELFTRLRNQKGLDTENLLQYLDGWQQIDEDNLEIIRAGLERYFADDYVSALHILVPQFEDVLRTFFEKAGTPIIKQRTGQRGWQFETLGNFLQGVVKQNVPLDLYEYVRLVMADQNGWNLRSRIAHGLIHPEVCIKPVADTVLHLFLLLTQFRVDSQSQSATEGEEYGKNYSAEDSTI